MWMCLYQGTAALHVHPLTLNGTWVITDVFSYTCAFLLGRQNVCCDNGLCSVIFIQRTCVMSGKKKFDNTGLIPACPTYSCIGPWVVAAGCVELWDTVACPISTLGDIAGNVLCIAQQYDTDWGENKYITIYITSIVIAFITDITSDVLLITLDVHRGCLHVL